MTVYELMEKLKEMPQDYEVFVKASTKQMEKANFVLLSSLTHCRQDGRHPIIMIVNSKKDILTRKIY